MAAAGKLPLVGPENSSLIFEYHGVSAAGAAPVTGGMTTAPDVPPGVVTALELVPVGYPGVPPGTGSARIVLENTLTASRNVSEATLFMVAAAL